MLNLDQVRLLENGVEKAVAKILSLTAENTHLRTQLSTLQTRVGELEGLVRSFRDDQGRIEEGILNALDRLSAFEDTVYHAEEPAPAPVQTAASSSAVTSTGASSTAATSNAAPVYASEDEEIAAMLAETASGPASKPLAGPEPIQISAEWQNPVEDNRTAAPSSDGQMDIF